MNPLLAIVEPIVDDFEPKRVEHRPLGVLEVDPMRGKIAAGFIGISLETHDF